MLNGWSIGTSKRPMGWPLSRSGGAGSTMVPFANFGETIMFRVSNAGKSQLSWHEGIWLGRDTESDMHFVADSSGVFKTRSIRRNIPSQQAKLELLQSIKSTPWDPSGSKRETDAFILPLSKDEQQSQGAQKEDYEPSIAPGDQLEDFQDLPASGSDIALPQEGPPSRVRRHEEVSPDDDFVSRPRLDPSVTLDRKHEHESEEAGPGSKVSATFRSTSACCGVSNFIRWDQAWTWGSCFG